jgi:dTDP-4-dehydrorhamnose 3,5-epimerase-like enzyme
MELIARFSLTIKLSLRALHYHLWMFFACKHGNGQVLNVFINLIKWSNTKISGFH